MMRAIFLYAFIATLVSCDHSSSLKSENATGIDAILDQFEEQLQKDIEDDNLNGSISMAIVKGDKVLRSKAFGDTDLNHHAADTSTIYRIGSVTKSFTALLMMQLAQEGIIQIDDSIEKYLPEIRGLVGYSDSTKITFGQLASHTSGLHSGPNYGKPANATVKEWESLLLKCIPATSFGSRPGRRYSYSNIGFAILGLALSRAAEKSYIELIQTRIFNPLHMNNSFLLVPEERQSDLAQGRWGGPMGEVDDVRPKEDHTNIGWSVANGGIFSTPNDLTKFMFSMMGYSDILSEDYLEMMQTTQTPVEKWQENYGYGFTIYQDSIISTVGHQGGNPGYRANFLFEKETKYGVILLRNYSWGITDLNLRSTVLLRKLKEFEVKRER